MSKLDLYDSNPIDMEFLENITKDSFPDACLDNIFCIFKSINDIYYIIYTNKNRSIISLNLVNNDKINEIKNAHEETIRNFRYYLDKINKRDLIISISCKDNNIKLWNINNMECLLNIKNINKEGALFSACFLYDNNGYYILSSNCNFNGESERIKIFDLKGNIIKEINDSNDKIFFIDSYYDSKLSKLYIITGNQGYVKSFDYNENKIYFQYSDNNDKRAHDSIIINENKDKINIIESSLNGNIRIWDFHSKELLRRIKITKRELYGICLWNNDYLFVGCDDNSIKLIDLKQRKIIKEFYSHNNEVITIKKLIHPKYGECLISQGFDDQIKLWVNKNKK